MLRFCLGAFQDALCLRNSAPEAAPPLAVNSGTPGRCLLVLFTALATAYAFAIWLPGVCAERGLWPRRANPNLVLIRRSVAADDFTPSITAKEFRTWGEHKQRFFEGFAFFWVAPETVAADAPRSGSWFASRRLQPAWNIAHASTNLFPLLGLPIRFAAPQLSSTLPQVILSERTWKTQFGADPDVTGTEVRLADRVVRIAGVSPDGSLALPGHVDAWELTTDVERGSPHYGFVVAPLTEAGKAQMWTNYIRITAYAPEGYDDDLFGVSLAELRPSPTNLYLFAVLLALLALPAITSVSLGESTLNPQRVSWRRKLVRWSFLSAKMALLFPLIYFVSFDFAYGFTALGRETAVNIQLLTAFVACLFGMRWVLKDQRQRCPVCLHTVCHPAHVGQASWTFLDWNGTEMVCMGGHTMLHVPSLPTSWFGSQRWLYLDTSWQFLFAGSTRPTP